jgi:hypothetical protein
VVCSSDYSGRCVAESVVSGADRRNAGEHKSQALNKYSSGTQALFQPTGRPTDWFEWANNDLAGTVGNLRWVSTREALLHHHRG